MERKLAAEEAERQRIAEEKRQKEEEKRREEEKKRLDEEQPDVEHRHVEMKEKSLWSAKNRFAADTVSYFNFVTDFRKNTRMLIRYLILLMKGTSHRSLLFGKTVKVLT